MSSHLPLLPFINPCSLSFSIHTSSFQFLKNPTLSSCSPSSPTMAKTRGAHSYRPQVRQGPTPPTGPSTPGPSSASGPTSAAAGAPLPPQLAPALAWLLHCPFVAAASPAPAAVQSPAAGDAKGSPLWPLPRGDIIPGLAPLHLLLRIPGQPRGPHSPRGPGLQAQGSHPLPDPEATLTALSGHCRSSGSIPCIHYQATLLPLRPHPGECQLQGERFPWRGYYDLPAFTADPGLRDSMLLVLGYHLEPFMVSRQFFILG